MTVKNETFTIFGCPVIVSDALPGGHFILMKPGEHRKKALDLKVKGLGHHKISVTLKVINPKR